MIDFYDLIERNAALNAFVDFDRQACAGSGPLGDLTIGIKSNIAVAAMPWTGGMESNRGWTAARDAESVWQLRQAGAAILGTLNMHEAALGATSDNIFYGRTHNPLRIGHTAGGSSGGSAAAVAGGLCDAALGTDTMGSVRIPAAYCGIYGLKPTHGAVGTGGLIALEPSLDVIGPLARSLEVLERVWEVLRAEEASEGQPLARVLTLANLGGVEVQPGVAAAYARALALLGPAHEIALPHTPHDIRMAGFLASAHALIADLGEVRVGQPELFSPELHAMLDYAATRLPQPEVLAAARAALIELIGDDGVLVMPTAPQEAFAHDTRAPANQADFACLASVAGLPALAIPFGTGDDGLPVGIQLVGPAASESRLIGLARRIEGDVQ